MSEVFFIDKKGNKISCDKVNSHIGLANIVIENDEKLKQEFQRSGKQNPVEFFLENKEYMAGNEGYHGRLTYDSEFVSDEQKRWINHYVGEEGYEHHDLARERRIMQKEKLDRGEG